MYKIRKRVLFNFIFLWNKCFEINKKGVLFVIARSNVSQDNREEKKRSYEQLFGWSQQTDPGWILEKG